MKSYQPTNDAEFKHVQEERHTSLTQEFPLSPWQVTMLDEIKDNLQSPILDVGTRNGLLLDELKSRGFDAVGLEITDIADYAISQGRNVIKGDIQKKTQWDDGYFHTTIATHVIEHCYDPESALKEIRRITDGYVFFAIPLQGDVDNGSWLNMGHYTGFNTAEEFSNFILKHGFETIKIINDGVWNQMIIAKTI